MTTSSYDLLKNCLQGQQKRVDETLGQVLAVRKQLKHHRDQLEYLLSLDTDSQTYLNERVEAQSADYLLLLQEMIAKEQECVSQSNRVYEDLISQLNAEKNGLRQMLSILGQDTQRKSVRKITMTESRTATIAGVQS